VPFRRAKDDDLIRGAGGDAGGVAGAYDSRRGVVLRGFLRVRDGRGNNEEIAGYDFGAVRRKGYWI
jgi:hypothetical protein